MGINIVALLIGIIVAASVIYKIKQSRLMDILWFYPLFLASFPIYYWFFSLYALDFFSLFREVLIGLIFMFIAWLAYKNSGRVALYILAFGFVGHGAYDVLHVILNETPVAPNWWPEFCGAVDVIVGLYMLQLIRNRNEKLETINSCSTRSASQKVN